jgi:cyanophycinase
MRFAGRLPGPSAAILSHPRERADGYNQYVFDLGPLNSVETLVIKNRQAASDSRVVDIIENADALNGSITSAQALANPFDRRLTLGRDFLAIPRLAGVITYSHFVERDRMGRFVAFLARIVQDGRAPKARGIAIDSQTAVLDEAGAATVVGSGTAYFLQTPLGLPQACQPKTPLTFRDLTVYRVDAGGNFNIPTWASHGGTAYQISSDAGVLTTTQASGGVY